MAFDDLQYLGNEAHVNYDDLGNGLDKNYTAPENQMRSELPRSSKPGFVQSKKSAFNNFYNFSGDPSNIWMDEDVEQFNLFKNPSVENLVTKGKGANKFDWTDFTFATKLGEIHNNRLVTLRRFKYPVDDDIFGTRYEPDIGRLCTWMDQNENRLQDIFSMSYGMNWKQLTAEMESMQQSTPGIGYSGVIGTILDKYISPNTNPQDYYDPKFDQNKAYGPVDSIHKTHIRDVGLNFETEFELVFRYQLRSVEGVNAKTVMMDLLSHILAVTHNDGKFWGGARYWAGRPPSPYASRIRNWTNENFAAFTQSSNVNIKSLFGSLASSISERLTPENVVNMATKVLKNMAISKALDFAGRASVPLMNSLLTSDPVGEWHLTVGNPFRPILVCGNLILQDTKIEAGSGTLGYDDFPTEIVVTCRLKPAMPRDRAGVEKMFTVGNSRTYWKPTKADFQKITRTGNYVKDSMKGHSAGDIAVVGRELYSFAQTQLYGYDKSLQPVMANEGATGAPADQNTTTGTTVTPKTN